MKETAVVVVHVPNKSVTEDLEIPLYITANDLIEALAAIYQVPFDPDRIFSFYVKCESPKALLRGQTTLSDYGVRDGSNLWLWDERLQPPV